MSFMRKAREVTSALAVTVGALATVGGLLSSTINSANLGLPVAARDAYLAENRLAKGEKLTDSEMEKYGAALSHVNRKDIAAYGMFRYDYLGSLGITGAGALVALLGLTAYPKSNSQSSSYNAPRKNL